MALTWAAPAPARGATTEGSLKSYRGIIHVHSNFSTGELSPAEVVAKAKKAGIKIVVFTDHDLVRASWGLPPFRNLLSYTMDFKPSVFQIGVDNYFDTIENLQSENSDMVIIPAIESAPFYYVSGNPIFGEMNIHDWRRHILLIGLGREAVKNLPVLHNGMSSRYFWTLLPGTILYLVPALFAIVLLPFRGWVRWAGFIVFFVGLIGAIDAHPFKSSPFSPYLGSQGARPYQEIINYTDTNGGLALWAHQGSLLSKQKTKFGNLLTPPHVEMLTETVNYHAFDAIYEDNYTASKPGRAWDKYLVGYLKGVRPKPIWGYGGIDFHSENELRGKKRVNDIENVFYMESLSNDAFYRALVNGRFYVSRGYTPARLQMDYFSLTSAKGQNSETYGGGLRFKGPPQISFQVSTRNGTAEKVKAQLIRMGLVIHTFEGVTPLKIDFVDRNPIDHKRFYYRLDVKGKRGEHIATNPVFVQR
ncbi:MAG: PHP domain-containing protein [Nitrospinaceae bacterium]|nr:PHP domain-containing protein [Nitrospinaceae bacterium]MBT3820179.1 PHP domain-containing protein [Nitrospinaceae bacterium]MBT4095617.1 PHP domain-containing protein [Nitrospinaceae bacterium]MBT4432714.1 PHP domain-containing protein [Nitrospinaceae bacterium]MBT5369988.1 PHP domain-containing protein [Nitrospinaceae bacterium]